MGCTMLVQMRMMPSPTADNSQRQMMQFMPLVFLFMFYSMPAGMILYWTCQNLFTILQQFLTNRRMDASAPVPAAPAGKSPSVRVR
jgi:YidC/Oxa1 family membrane protein insertase